MQLTVHVNIKRVLDGYTEQLKRRADTFHSIECWERFFART